MQTSKSTRDSVVDLAQTRAAVQRVRFTCGEWLLQTHSMTMTMEVVVLMMMMTMMLYYNNNEYTLFAATILQLATSN